MIGRVGRNRRWLSLLLVLGVILLIGVIFYQDQKEKQTAQVYDKNYETKVEKERARVDGIYDSVNDTVEKYLPGIVFWGDDTTVGLEKTGCRYPVLLENMISENVCSQLDMTKIVEPLYNSFLAIKDYDLTIPVVNMSISGEEAADLLGRSGAVPFVLGKGVVIPEKETAVEILIRTKDGEPGYPFRQDKSKIEDVMLGNVKGSVSCMVDSDAENPYRYYFTRSEAGKKVTVRRGTEFHFNKYEAYHNYLPVLCMGENEDYLDSDHLIAQQQAFLSYQNGPGNRFLVLGLISGTGEERQYMESRMEETYGRKFINLRKYLSEEGMEDASLKPTKRDQKMMNKGQVPESLMADMIHLNETGCKLTAKLIYERMEELGYLKEVQQSVQKAMTNK